MKNVSTIVSQDHWALPDDTDESYASPYVAPDPVSLQPAIQRWWWWFILAAIVSAPVAFFGAKHFATDSYVYDTRMIFNRSHFGAPLYEPPDIFAVAALTSSPAMLHEMKHTLKLQPDVERLESLLEPEVRGGSTVMSIELEWESKEKAQEILNWISERLVTRVKQLRDQRIDHSLADLYKQLDIYETATVDSHKELIDFRFRHNTFGVLEHLRTLESEQSMLDKSLAIAESEKDSLEAQLAIHSNRSRESDPNEALTEDDLDRVDLSLTSEEQRRNESDEKYTAVLNQIRQNRLQQSIRQERERALLSTQLDVKRRELSDAERLFARELIPQTEVRALADEVRLLELELSGTQKLKEWEQELATVSGRVDESMLEAARRGEVSIVRPAGGGPPTPAKSDMSDIREKWQLQFETKKKLVAWMEDTLEKTRQEKANLQALLPEAERLERKFQRAEFMRSRIEGQVTDLEMLRRSDSNLLAVLDPPSPGPIPVKSNKKKLMVAFYCLSTCILCAPIVLKELFAPPERHRSPRVAARPR